MMLHNNGFKDLHPENVGTFQHYNDWYMAQPIAPDYAHTESHSDAFSHSAPEAESSDRPFVEMPRAPKIIIIERQPSWASLYFSRFFSPFGFGHHHTTVHHHHHAPIRSNSASRRTNKEDNNQEAQQAGLLAAAAVFAALIAVAGISIAYSYSEIKKISDNLMAKRKVLPNLIKLGWAGLFGYTGLQMGIKIGAYYGPALLGTPALGSLVAGILLATATVSAGLIVGKYFAKLCTYIHTRGKTTNSDPYSIAPSPQQKIDGMFTQQTAYPDSRANLMYGYVLNKIDIANTNKAPKQWLNTLEGFKKQLKAGEFSKDLRDYFDSEWGVVRNAWYNEKQAPQIDARYVNTKIHKIEHDFKALAVITSQERILTADQQYFMPHQPAYPQYFGMPQQPEAGFGYTPNYAQQQQSYFQQDPPAHSGFGFSTSPTNTSGSPKYTNH